MFVNLIKYRIQLASIKYNRLNSDNHGMANLSIYYIFYADYLLLFMFCIIVC